MLKLEQAIADGKVDEGIVHLLDNLNDSDSYYTTSSCAGRIQIIEVDELGDKEGARVLGKWHRPIQFEEASAAISKHEKGTLYLLAQSPILHIACKDLDAALALKQTAVESGFKYSGIKSVNGKGQAMLEVLSSENVDAPLAEGGEAFITNEYLYFLLDKANACIQKAQGKLRELEGRLSCPARNLSRI